MGLPCSYPARLWAHCCINHCPQEQETFAPQSAKLCALPRQYRERSRALIVTDFAPHRPKYIQMSNKEDMAMDDRWTICRVSGEARKQVEELHMLTGIPYGRLVSEAITIWYNQFQTSKPARGLHDHFFWHAQNLTQKPVA